MKVQIYANIVDQSTQRFALAMHPKLMQLCPRLEGEYGGFMEHLWIDIELLSIAEGSGNEPRFPFRFQKRVSGRSRLGLPPIPDHLNVGHFSVRPDFQHLAELSDSQALVYLLGRVYERSAILLDKVKRLGGFNAESFRQRFSDACAEIGCQIEA
jgi:hypothetical protein